MNWFKSRIDGREIRIDMRFPVNIIHSLLHNFIYSNLDSNGYLPYAPREMDDELESYFAHLGYPQVKCCCHLESSRMSMDIYFNDIEYDIDLTHKVFDVLRGTV